MPYGGNEAYLPFFDGMVQARYSEAEAQRLIRTLTESIRYCHDANVVHRDLKVPCFAFATVLCSHALMAPVVFRAA